MRGLIIEDDATTRSLVKRIVKKYGNIEEVENGDDGILKVKKAIEDKKHFDFICLDLAMPGKSGFEVLDEIRKMEKDNDIVGINESNIIIMSAFNQMEDIKKGYKKYCDHYLVKPFKKSDLMGILDNLNNQKKK